MTTPNSRPTILATCPEFQTSLEKAGSGPPNETHPLVTAMMSRPRIIPNTPEWFSERRIRITATNVSAILYDTPQTALDVFRKKTGQVLPMAATDAMRYGIAREAEAAQVYERLTGLKIYHEPDIGLIVHRDYPDIAASPDRILNDYPILIEIKCPFKRRIQRSTIPSYYLPQVQMQLEVCDIDVCHFVQYKPPTQRSNGILDVSVVYRDRQWWQNALPHLLRFHEAVRDYYQQIGRPMGSNSPDAEPEKPTPFRFKFNHGPVAAVASNNEPPEFVTES